MERVKEKALAPFRGLRIQPTVTVDPQDGTFSFAFGVGRGPADIDATLERLLQLPASSARARRHRTALFIDEFQEVVEIDPHLPNLMRAVFQQQPEVAHLYLGSKRHVMQRIFNDENEPFWRSAKSIELGPIPAVLFQRFIAERFTDTGKEIGEATSDRVLAHTGGHPYATQELCYFLWEETPSGEAASAARLELAMAAVLRSEHAHFSLLWDGASRVQRLVLQALAREPGRPFRADYRSRHELATRDQRAEGPARAGAARDRHRRNQRIPHRRAVPRRVAERDLASAWLGELGAVVELLDVDGARRGGFDAELAEDALVEVLLDDLDPASASLKMSTGQTSSSLAASAASPATESSTSTSMKTLFSRSAIRRDLPASA